ncbi:MAG: hypothetical protein V8T87_07975 [Victivallales bacterium]
MSFASSGESFNISRKKLLNAAWRSRITAARSLPAAVSTTGAWD